MPEENLAPQLPSDVSRRDATERDTSRHTLTIKQAADLFFSLGVPRSPRSVQRFCERGNLDAIQVKGEKTERYFINPQSIERYAKELKQLENISQLGDALQRDVSRHDATEPVAPITPASAPEGDGETAELRKQVDALEKEKGHLQIDLAARVIVINQMVDERRSYIEQITGLSRENGRLEMQVQQLAAPKGDTSRHDATAAADVTVLQIEEEGRGAHASESMPEPTPASATEPQPKPSRSWWPW